MRSVRCDANDADNEISRRRWRRNAPQHSVAAHVIYKRRALTSTTDYAFMEMDLPGTGSSTHRRSKRSAPATIYPEILVIVDYDGYRLHNGDNAEIKKYFVSFWNGVDLRYKLLKGPKVRISIAGIIISRGRDATPYFEKNRVGSDAIDSTAALTDMGKYLFQERRLPVYDIAVAITKFRLRRWRLRRQQATGEGQQRCHRRGHWRLLRHHRRRPRSRTLIGIRSRWFTTTELPGRTRSAALPLGGRLHHERLASHRTRIQMVLLQYLPVRSFPQR